MLTPRRLLYIATGGRLRRRIGVRITAGFAISALLTLLVAIISLYYNREAGRELARISERDRAISADFRQLVLAVEQQHGAVQSFLLSGDESVIGQVDAARQRFQQTLLRLEGALPEAERAGTFERIRAQADKLSEVATDDIGLYRQGWTATAYFLWRSDGTQARDTLTSTIDQQIATHNAAVDREINDSRDRLRATFAAAVLLVVLGAVTAFVIGVNLIRSVTEPVRALMSMVAGIRSGDLRSRAPVIGENELAELTRTMNAMAANLEHSRGELEKALTDTARSELRYRTITEQAKDIIFTVQPDGIINFVSPAVSTILGFAADDLVGKNVEMLYTPDTRSQMASYGPWDLPGPRPFAGVIELRTKDQRTIQLDINTTVLTVRVPG